MAWNGSEVFGSHRVAQGPFHYHDPMKNAPRHAAARSSLAASLIATGLLCTALGAAAQTPAPPSPTREAAQASPEVVNSGLNAPLFYQLLLGELNVRAGEPGTGYSLILDAAINAPKDGLVIVTATFIVRTSSATCAPC